VLPEGREVEEVAPALRAELRREPPREQPRLCAPPRLERTDGAGHLPGVEVPPALVPLLDLVERGLRDLDHRGRPGDDVHRDPLVAGARRTRAAA
jgi:hypothetical protein